MKYFTKKDLKNKKIIMRVDFNVKINDEGIIMNDYKIRKVLFTIKTILSSNIKSLILISHMGRPKGRRVKELSLTPLIPYLESKLNIKINFVSDLEKKNIEKIKSANEGEVFLLENIRFWSEEEKNDKLFSKKLSQMGNVFVNDAFSVSHREHSSIVGITNFLPSFGGILMKKEIENLKLAKERDNRPFSLVLGGKKISDKLPLVKFFRKKIDFLLLGGAVANTILKTMDFEVGKSLIDESVDMKMVGKYFGNKKNGQMNLMMPGDLLVASSKNDNLGIERHYTKVLKDDIILDIGLHTRICFENILNQSKTIIWNGPMGYCENENFTQGTEVVARAIANSPAFSVVGGGDTISAIEKFGLLDKFDFVSTGGGAMLEFLSGNKLPGLVALEKNSEEK